MQPATLGRSPPALFGTAHFPLSDNHLFQFLVTVGQYTSYLQSLINQEQLPYTLSFQWDIPSQQFVPTAVCEECDLSLTYPTGSVLVDHAFDCPGGFERSLVAYWVQSVPGSHRASSQIHRRGASFYYQSHHLLRTRRQTPSPPQPEDTDLSDLLSQLSLLASPSTLILNYVPPPPGQTHLPPNPSPQARAKAKAS